MTMLNNRIIFKDNTVLNDVSVNLNEFRLSNVTLPIVAAQDSLYIGSELPFNHRYFHVGTANTAASVISVAIWDGTEWEPAVDVLDQTAVGGKTFSQSGIISWSPDRNGSGWGLEDTTEDISALSTLKIYDLYWAKFTFSADLSLTTALKYVGHKFSRDEQLAGIYPELALSATMAQFESGKTTWDEQHIKASEIVVRDLIRKYKASSVNQVMNWESYSGASLHQLAAIVFRAFGDDYQDQLDQALKDYKIAFNIESTQLDKNKNGKLDRSERTPVTGIVRR